MEILTAGSLWGLQVTAEDIATTLPADGNHYVRGAFDLAAARATDIPLDGTPVWVVGLAAPDSATDAVWAVALCRRARRRVLAGCRDRAPAADRRLAVTGATIGDPAHG